MENLQGIAYQVEINQFRPHFFHGAVEPITGYSADDFLQNRIRWDEIIHPEDLARVMDESQKLLTRAEYVADNEYRIVRKDGTTCWVRDVAQNAALEHEGAVIINGLLWDVTARRQADERLRRSEARLRSIFRASPVGISLLRGGVFVEVNRRFCDITGYTEQELVGNSGSFFFPSDEAYRTAQRQAAEGIQRSGMASIEGEILRKEGRFADVLVNAVPLDPADPEAGITYTLLDITERKQAETERRKLEAQVQHVQKLESLGVLAGGIAHDFNNLLVAILGNTDLARRVLSPASPAQSYLREIEAASRRAADLCRQMLAYSGKGRFVIETLDVNEVVEEMARMLEVSISKKAVLKYELTRGLPVIEADVVQVRQVLMNLITNASEAIGDKSGIISIATGALRCDSAYLEETHLADDLAEGTYIYVEVADTGCGVTPEVRARMFDPFFTTKFTGRGLGMAAALGIVRGHRGAIKINSEPGKGTTVKVLFPASEKAVRARSDRVPVGGDWKGEGTVLLVDDEQSILAVATSMLEMMGFTVVTASDGREALQVFREHEDDIVCVLLDLTMPRMDGGEAFRELRRIKPDVRVIMTSGYNEQEVTQRFVGKGLAGFLQKPFLYDALLASLREALEG